MSLKLRKQIEIERLLLRQLIDDHRPLLKKCAVVAPDRIELSALATMLHAFYSGVENVFKRISIEFGEATHMSPKWHRNLLESMKRPTETRSAVVSSETAKDLREYMDFRHVFRNAYPFQLHWGKMASLVREIEDVHRRFDRDVSKFLEGTRDL